MAAYRIEIMPSALKALKGIDRRDRERLREKIRSLSDVPRPEGIKALAGGEGFLRLRVGDYRVVYEIHDARLLVVVLKLGHRRDVYR